MANNYLTGDVIVDRMLAHLTEEVTFLDKINTQYDSHFSGKGAKKGDSVRVRIPQHAKIRRGRIADETPINDRTVAVSLDEQVGVDVGANSADLALNIDDFDAQYIKPFAADLAVAIEGDVLRKVLPQVSETVGDGGELDMRKVLNAGKRLDYNLAPKSDRILVVNPDAQVQAIEKFSTLFNNQATIGKQYTKGRMGSDTLGFDWYSSNMMPTLTRGTATTGTVTTANQSGNTLQVNVAGVIKPGDVFTIAGVFAVHPQTKEQRGYLQKFTVTEETVGGQGTIKITPELRPSGTEQNVSAAPAAGAVITVEGDAGAIMGQNLAFTKDAFYFVTADMPVPKSMEAAGSRLWNGLKLRYVQGFDIANDRWLSRFDIIYGAGVLRPEFAVRIPTTMAAE